MHSTAASAKVSGEHNLRRSVVHLVRDFLPGGHVKVHLRIVLELQVSRIRQIHSRISAGGTPDHIDSLESNRLEAGIGEAAIIYDMHRSEILLIQPIRKLTRKDEIRSLLPLVVTAIIQDLSHELITDEGEALPRSRESLVPPPSIRHLVDPAERT